MNVAHCIHGLDLGGAQQIIKYIVRGSDLRSFRHCVYSPAGGVFRQQIEEAGATVRIIKRRIPKLDPFWVAALARAMRRDAIDIVHTHLFGDSLHGYLAARAAGALPVVMTLHIGPRGLTGLQRQGYRWLLAGAARNIACAESVAQAWRSEAPASIQTIPNAVEAPRADLSAASRLRQGLAVDLRATLIGAIGRLVEQKGFADLIRAVAQIVRSSNPAVQLVIVGDGPLRADLERRAASEGIGNLVTFAGSRADVAECLTVFDVVAFGSHFEGLPLALLEAMAAGRCIVATRAPGITDAVTDGREALLAPIGDIDSLSAALGRVLADPALRRRLAEAARQRFLREFTAGRMVEGYETVYREVYAGARRTDQRPARRSDGDDSGPRSHAAVGR